MTIYEAAKSLDLPPSEHGTAKIVHFEVSKMEAAMTAWGGGLSYVRPGKYLKLITSRGLQMSNTDMEQSTNSEVCRRAHGQVLIAGLGIGLILRPILAKDSVSAVTVVEIDADVIALVKPHYDDARLNVVNADIHDWKPCGLFNTIYFDIWPDICTDNLEQIRKLHGRGKYWLDRSDTDCWMGSWVVDYLRAERRRGR